MTIDEVGARQTAERLDAVPESQRGPLHGLPIAFKDLVATAGVKTTYGSLVQPMTRPSYARDPPRPVQPTGGIKCGSVQVAIFGGQTVLPLPRALAVETVKKTPTQRSSANSTAPSPSARN
jgi:amidase